MPEESLTLAELRVAQDILEAKAQRLRQTLHELCSARPADWQAAFIATQDELLAVVILLGRTKNRIRLSVEGEIGPTTEEEDNECLSWAR